MKRIIALILALCAVLSLAACGASQKPISDGSSVHKIGVIVYNTADQEVNGFREYLKGYIENSFEMVEFVYSGSITSAEEELEFIQSACSSGVEGFLSFLSHDLAAEVALCEKNRAYYLLASGTVSDADFSAVADNPWFLGMFGPGKAFEYEAGTDMADFFLGKNYGSRWFILSGGAPLGNEMHYQRTMAILDTLAKSCGASFPKSIAELAGTSEPVTLTLDRLTVTVCPGYISREPFLSTAKQAWGSGDYDQVLSVLPPEGMADVIGRTPLGIVDSFNVRNLQLFNSGSLQFVVGKYSSMIGPAFALMLNAVTGHAADFRDNGRAIRVVQGFWTAGSADEYTEMYTLSQSVSMNAYSFDDLSRVLRIYNPDATLNDLVALAEACSYRAVQARRSERPLA